MFKTILVASLATMMALGANLAPAASHVPAEKASTWEEIKAWSYEKKNDAVATGRKMLATTDRKIEELEAQARKSGKDTQAAHQQNMKDLQAQRKAAAEKLAQLEQAGATAWNGTRDAFASAYKQLTDSQDKAGAAVGTRP